MTWRDVTLRDVGWYDVMWYEDFYHTSNAAIYFHQWFYLLVVRHDRLWIFFLHSWNTADNELRYKQGY